jgi:hypothetical protein
LFFGGPGINGIEIKGDKKNSLEGNLNIRVKVNISNNKY